MLFGSVRIASARVQFVWFGSARIGSARVRSDRLGLIRLESVRLDHGSARSWFASIMVRLDHGSHVSVLSIVPVAGLSGNRKVGADTLGYAKSVPLDSILVVAAFQALSKNADTLG